MPGGLNKVGHSKKELKNIHTSPWHMALFNFHACIPIDKGKSRLRVYLVPHAPNLGSLLWICCSSTQFN